MSSDSSDDSDKMNDYGQDILVAAGLSLDALALAAEGKFAEAEDTLLAALEIRKTAKFGTPLAVAGTRHSLGELYLKMNRLDDAQYMFEMAWREFESKLLVCRSCRHFIFV